MSYIVKSYIVKNLALDRIKISYSLMNENLIGDRLIMKVGECLSARVRRVPWGNNWDTRFVKERVEIIDRLKVTSRVLEEI